MDEYITDGGNAYCCESALVCVIIVISSASIGDVSICGVSTLAPFNSKLNVSKMNAKME